MNQPIKSASQFMAGQKACIDGLPCPEHAHSDYVRGYAAQYELEQINTEMSLKRTKPTERRNRQQLEKNYAINSY